MIFRACQIVYNLFSHGLDQILLKNKAPSKLFLGSLSAAQLSKNAIAFALKLGPIFIKFGQIISTRPDLFSHELSLALAQLQDKVPGLDQHKIERIIKESIPECPLTNISSQPLGSGSIAQVHEALLDNMPVVVKVLRPGLNKQLKKDISAIKFLVWLVTLVRSRFRKLQLFSFVDEFHLSLRNEIDLRQEASNYTTMALNFSDDDRLYIPKVYDDFTRANILVLEKISAVKISDLPESDNINRKLLAENGVKIFFTQVLRDRFFHADMHPGNVFVDIKNPSKPQYIAIDFGIIGVLTPEDTFYLASNLQAFFQRDYHEIARLHLESQWVEGHIRIDLFEQAIRTVCEPIYAKPIGEISFALLLEKLILIAERFELIPQPQLLLLQKTLLNVEGLGRSLYPQLNLWETALPLLDEHFSPLKTFQKNLKSLPHKLSRLERYVKKTIDDPQTKPIAPSNTRFIQSCLLLSILLNSILVWRLWG